MAGRQNEADPGRSWLLRRLDALLAGLGDRLNRLYLLVNRRLRGYPALFYRVGLTFGDHGGSFMAASLAYYALLSLFPLLLLLIATGSSVLTAQEAKRVALEVVARYLPGSIELASGTIEQVLRERGAIRVVAALGLLWSASGVFSAMFQAVNRAWGEVRPTPAWKSRLLALATTLIIGLLFLLTLALSTILCATTALNQPARLLRPW